MLYSFFSRYAAEQGEGRLLEHGHVHGHILVGQAPFGVGARLPREACFVDIDDTKAISPCISQLPLHLVEPIPLFLGILILGRLDPSQLLSLDSMERVYLPQLRGIYLGVGKLLDEMLASIVEG